MPRVIGIDPGTLSIDLCGLDDGHVFIDRTLRAGTVSASPSALMSVLERAHREAPLDLIAGPSGYGLPLKAGRELTEDDLRLALLAPAREPGGVAGLGDLMRAIKESSLPAVFTPGVVHLPTVPAYRKVNRVDMGTADKVCAAALAIDEQARRRACDPAEVSFILLELGGAFTAAIAVQGGRIVDGVGGTSGPIGARAAGALDGEVAFLAGTVTKRFLFGGGAASVANAVEFDPEALVIAGGGRGRVAWEAYLEGAVKAVAALAVSVPRPHELILSGRLAHVDAVGTDLTARLTDAVPGAPVHVLHGFATVAKQAAQGAALIADGLAGGRSRQLVDTMMLRESSGSILDHLYVITAAAARQRLGLAGADHGE